MGSDTHTHDGSGTSDSVSNLPPSIDVILGKLDTTSPIIFNMITMWDGPVPALWNVTSNMGDDFDGVYINAAATYDGTPSGSVDHTHSDLTVTTGFASGSHDDGNLNDAGSALDAHTHDITVDYTTNNHEPPFIEAIFAKRLAEKILIQPDAGVPGMNLVVQFIGDLFNKTSTVTTSSSDIKVGPITVTDVNGDVVTTGGNVLTTVFFIDPSASPQTVTVTIDGVALPRTFEIIPITGTLVGSGDYSSAPGGTYTLGDGGGNNGNRTKGGVIILDELDVPVGITLNINVTDLDLGLAGNQGYLPAIILVAGDIDIQGTINVLGSAGAAASGDDGGDGGDGGPGGGGGGGGGADGEGCAGSIGGDGGAGFTGGAGASGDFTVGGIIGGDGGDGTGSFGVANSAENGGNGGRSIAGNATVATGGVAAADGGGGGGGGTGFVFGSGGTGGANDLVGNRGNGGSGGAGAHNDNPSGGGGFGTAGEDGVGPDDPSLGGFAHGNSQIVPIAGGSGAGGGGNDDSGGCNDGSGGGGGGGGAVLIYSTGAFDVTGTINTRGGAGGASESDKSEAGAGGGGSGGSIILQGRNVDVTTGPGTLDARGGLGFDEADLDDGGDGGAGRLCWTCYNWNRP